MNNFPAITEEQRQELIDWAKGYIDAAERYTSNNPTDRSGKAYLELLQIALAALTAEPEVWIKPDSLGFPRLAGIDAVTIPYVPEYPIPLYTAPPAPVLKPIELPKKYVCDKNGCDDDLLPSWQVMISCDEIIAAIRAAGYEVKP